jgi:HAD superfamily hydrolase (TIGR01509 family)
VIRRFQGVLLDVDGTLVDSNDAHALAWHDAFAEAELDIAAARVRRLVGMGGDHLIELLAGYPPGSRQHRRLAQRHGEIFAERYLRTVHPFPGTRALVLALRAAGYLYAIASSSKGDDLDRLLAIAGVDDLCDRRASSSDVASSKPDPDIVEAALAKLPVRRERVVLLGDTPYDVRAARSAGVATIGMSSGGFSAEMLSGAIAIFDGPADLLARWASSPLGSSQCA